MIRCSRRKYIVYHNPGMLAPQKLAAIEADVLPAVG